VCHFSVQKIEIEIEKKIESDLHLASVFTSQPGTQGLELM